MRIIIIDDDHLVCTSLKTILNAQNDMDVLAVGHHGEEAIALYTQHQPDVLLMDIRMDIMDGLTAGQQIIQQYPDARILYLTTFSDDEYIIQALRIGAKGFILKQHFESIVPAIRTVHMGQNVYGDEVIHRIPQLMNNPAAKPAVDHLTDRENELLHHIAQGLSNKEIADTMFLSDGTVRNYISALLVKLDLRDRTQLAIYYYKYIQ